MDDDKKVIIIDPQTGEPVEGTIDEFNHQIDTPTGPVGMVISDGVWYTRDKSGDLSEIKSKNSDEE